jgi:hypothetical protein
MGDHRALLKYVAGHLGTVGQEEEHVRGISEENPC